MTVADLKRIIDEAVARDPNLNAADVIVRVSINDADDLYVGGLASSTSATSSVQPGSNSARSSDSTESDS